MRKVILGQNGPAVSALGLGCMGMSEFYGRTDDETSKTVIRQALENGVTMLDTADAYGDGHNEQLIAEVLKERDRDVFVATKFGIVRTQGAYERKICGRPQYMRESLEKSLKRLGRDCIDLYYVHRIDAGVPIEDTVGAMSDLVQEGKINYIGLSEPSVETLLKAHAVHPITCVQTEYSLFTREAEASLLPVLRKNGIGFVPYSPLGRGMLSGTLTRESMENDSDFRQYLPRTSGENYTANMALVGQLREIALSKGITLSQLALAWVLSQGDDLVPIPGTRNPDYLMENIHAVEVVLTPEEIGKIEAIAYPGAVKGDRYTSEGMKGVNC